MKAKLFGYISNVNLDGERLKQRNSIISGLAVAMREETADTTVGIATISGQYPKLLKKTISPRNFVFLDEYQKLINESPLILMGATGIHFSDKGMVQQPFDIGSINRIIGTFDGYLTNKSDLSQIAESDGEAFQRYLWAKDNDYQTAISRMVGGCDSIWWSKDTPNKLHLFSSPYQLCFATVKSLKTTFYANEKYILEGILTSVLGKKLNYATLERNFVYEISTKAEIKKTRIVKKDSTVDLFLSSGRTKEQDSDYSENSNYLTPKQILAIDKALFKGCEKCKKDLLIEDTFYHNPKNSKLRCSACFEKSRFKDAWTRYTESEYIDLVADVEWTSFNLL